MRFAWRWMVLGAIVCVVIGWETNLGYALVAAMLMVATTLATLAASSDGYIAQRRRIVELEQELLELEQEASMLDRRNQALARRIAQINRDRQIDGPTTKGDLTS